MIKSFSVQQYSVSLVGSQCCIGHQEEQALLHRACTLPELRSWQCMLQGLYTRWESLEEQGRPSPTSS